MGEKKKAKLRDDTTNESGTEFVYWLFHESQSSSLALLKHLSVPYQTPGEMVHEKRFGWKNQVQGSRRLTVDEMWPFLFT